MGTLMLLGFICISTVFGAAGDKDEALIQLNQRTEIYKRELEKLVKCMAAFDKVHQKETKLEKEYEDHTVPLKLSSSTKERKERLNYGGDVEEIVANCDDMLNEEGVREEFE